MLNTRILLLLTLILSTVANSVQAGKTGDQRVLDLQGTQNTRDIGGYVTSDNRRVRHGLVFRSDNLSRLTPGDFQRLEAIGLRTIVDLRTPKEVKRAPTLWQGENAPRIFNYPVGQNDGEWFREQAQLLRKGRFKRQDLVNHFVNGYRAVPAVGLESYRKLMALVLDESNWPLLIHCSAGKDRTGIATALILEMLGVDRETIMTDYLLTNEVARTRKQAEKLAAQQAKKRTSTGSMMNSFRPPGAEAYFPLVGVLPEMLNGFYSGVEQNYGSMDVYLGQLGIDRANSESLIRKLTE